MRLTPYIQPGLVLTDLRASGVEDVFHLLAERLAAEGTVSSPEETSRVLLARERAHSTCLGDGIALPHATVPGLDEPLLAVAVAAEPVDVGADELGPVRIFFVLLSPPGRESDHIKLMARICRLARHPEFIDELLEADGPSAALEVIERVDGEHV